MIIRFKKDDIRIHDGKNGDNEIAIEFVHARQVPPDHEKIREITSHIEDAVSREAAIGMIHKSLYDASLLSIIQMSRIQEY